MDLGTVKFLWHHSWLNGPFDGLAELQCGQKVWFRREEEPMGFVSSIEEARPSDTASPSVAPLEINDDLLEAFFNKSHDDKSIEHTDNILEQVLAQAHENYKK